MKKKPKIVLQFFNEQKQNKETEEQLMDLLSQSQFSKSTKPSSKVSVSRSIIEETNPSFQYIFNAIKQMREKGNAPVDVQGPQELYDQNASLDDQRFQILTKDEVTGDCMREMLKFPCTIDAVSDASFEEIKNIIFKANFNSTKAKRIIQAAQKIKTEYNGKMPESFEEVMKFEGVGEKIALLYSSVALQKCIGIAVDVNVLRVCNRIPITRADSPSRMRRALEKLVPRENWEEFNQTIVGFGQQICRPAGRELCEECLLKNQCEHGMQRIKEKLQKQSMSKSKIKSRNNSKSKGTENDVEFIHKLIDSRSKFIEEF